MIDKRLLVLALLFVVSISVYFTFSKQVLSELGYGQLLGKASYLSGMDIVLVKSLAVAAAFLASAVLFFGLCGWAKEYDEKDLLPSASIAILLLLSPFVMENIVFVDSPAGMLSLPLFTLGAVVLFSEGNKRWLGLIPLAAGLAMTYPYIALPQTIDGSMAAGFPILIALAFLGLGYYLAGDRKNLGQELIALAAGVVTLFLLEPLSLAFFALAAGMAMKKFMETHGKIVLLTLVFALTFFLSITITAPLSAFISAASLAVFAYILLSLYNFEVKGFVPYLMIALVAFSLCADYFMLGANQSSSADAYFIDALKHAKANGLEVAVLGYKNTYQFYMQRYGAAVSEDMLMSGDAPNYKYLLLSYSTLQQTLAKYPIVFAHYASATNKDGSISEIFYSEKYALVVAPNAEGKITSDGSIYSLSTGGFVKTVPFTKIKLINGATASDAKSVLVNIDGYEDTQLYGLLMTGETVYSNDGGRIVKVG